MVYDKLIIEQDTTPEYHGMWYVNVKDTICGITKSGRVVSIKDVIDDESIALSDFYFASREEVDTAIAAAVIRGDI